MKAGEADRVIAEYMGATLSNRGMLIELGQGWEPYSNDLNALVPVWEKLRLLPRIMESKLLHNYDGQDKYQVALFGFNHVAAYGCGYSDLIQAAAAIATAKAIQALEEGE